MIEESEYLKQWKALPRSKRERLTKKQIAMIDRPDLMTDALSIATVRPKKAKGTFVVEDATNKANENLFEFIPQPATSNKLYKED